MDFSTFIEIIPKVKKIPLIGVRAHEEMLPLGRDKEYEEALMNPKKPMDAGVLALFYPDPVQETRLLLILRNTSPGVHSGQMGFPGGRVEARDENLEQTALRETYEEIGVLPSKVQIIRKMTKTYIPPSNFWVHPYVGFAKSTPRFRRQESEVKELVSVKFDDFMNDRNIVTESLTTSYGEYIDVPAFALNNKIVWGATAMMLNEIKSLFKEVL